ncbi:phage major capsid protein [Paenarthrobacter sp. DKR-5]|uniref:phage major capsid protein n=1 Tax=Paenarthrobacter sp. DKR-5 TaxID=2835535 RepID=UPI001BDDC0D1|nr:phage major capsid protein [Paenarthrobacter sp. DKR-5]MBT1001185.1 phage major capsid protein [Paenarthrobacter sp. DKR-5]
MSNTIEARRAIAELATKSQAILKNNRLSNVEKKTALDGLTIELKQHQETLKLHDEAKRLMVGGSAPGYGESPIAKNIAAGIATKGASVPTLSVPDDALEQAFSSLKGGGNFRAELGMKDAASSITTDGQLPPQFIGLVDKPFEPVRILDHLPTTPTQAPSVEFIVHASSSASAAAVAAGSAYPETSLATTQTIIKLEKLGILTTLTDELMADFATFRSYVSVELQRQIIDAENNALLNGSGTSPEIRGLLNTSGVITRAKGTESALDTIAEGIDDLRTGSSFCEPDALVIHPTTWGAIRREKDSYGRYLLGDPGQTAVSDVWGIPIVLTTQIAAGTAVLANLQIAATAFIRQGITLEMSNSSGNDFSNGLVKVRASERLALGVQRPSAVNILTALA